MKNALVIGCTIVVTAAAIVGGADFLDVPSEPVLPSATLDDPLPGYPPVISTIKEGLAFSAHSRHEIEVVVGEERLPPTFLIAMDDDRDEIALGNRDGDLYILKRSDISVVRIPNYIEAVKGGTKVTSPDSPTLPEATGTKKTQTPK